MTEAQLQRAVMQYGRLTFIGEAGFRTHPNGKRSRLWLCRCACGVEKTFMADSVRSGGAKSCGCGRKESPPVEVVARRAASLRKTDEEVFWRYASPEPNTGCWLWSGSIDGKGYGQIRRNNRLMYASHLALRLDGRAVPAGLCACHRCDNPTCVNPEHLFVGSHADNMRDMIAKGRHDWSGLELGRQLRSAA